MQALIRTSRQYGYEPQMLEAVEAVNANQKRLIPAKVVKRFGEGLQGKRFAVWGLSFKPDTDDMRESPAITIINELLDKGAEVTAYDPKAMRESQECYLKGRQGISYVDSKYEALKGADALLLLTEWKEFRQPDFEEIVKLLKNPVIFDGRNQLNYLR